MSGQVGELGEWTVNFIGVTQSVWCQLDNLKKTITPVMISLSRFVEELCPGYQMAGTQPI